MVPSDFPEGFEAEAELGIGSMGSVWLARNADGAHCAVKVLNLRQDRRGSTERSFNREVRAMARLDHPGIVAVHDYGRTPKGAPFVAMEYVSGPPLNRYMREDWSWGRLWTLLDALLAALGHAHAREIIHRDLKPGNVIVLPDRIGANAVKLADFGISLALSDTASSGRRIEGTPAYIAPEAASGNVAGIGPWTDLYSLGVMLFEIVTGDLPYKGRHLLAHHQRTPLPPVVIRKGVDVPTGIVPIIERLLEKSPLLRYRAVAAVRADLDRLTSRPTPEAIGPPPGLFNAEEDLPTDHDTLHVDAGAVGPGLIHLREPIMVGREDAQERLRTAANAVLDGRGPRVVIIEGNAGVGKSRLAAWLRERVEERGKMRTMVVRSEPQTGRGELRQALLRFIGASAMTLEEASPFLERVFPDPDLRSDAIELMWPQEPSDRVASESHIKQAARLIEHLAEGQPFLLWADDVQWSPEGKMLRLINRLGREGGGQNMFLVVTMRHSGRSTVQAARRASLKLPGAELIDLGPINPMSLAPTLDALGPLPEGVAEGACVLAAGNPLIALEAVRSHLRDTGLHQPPSDPSTVLQQRIAKATEGPGGGELLSALARATLLGRSFTLRPLLVLCGVQGDPAAPELSAQREVLEALLERAVDSGLAVEQGPKRWRFSHDLIRTQLRQACRELPNWAQINLAAAELRAERAKGDPTGIEMEVVARHYWAGGEHDRALFLGLEGVYRLFGSGLMGHTTSFVRRLLKWDGEAEVFGPEDRGELHLLASIAAEHAGQPDEAQTYAEQAATLAKKANLDPLGARAWGRVGMLQLRQDEMETAESSLWEALRYARASGDARALADVNLSLGYFYQQGGQNDLAITAFESSLDSALSGGVLASELDALIALARLDRLLGHVSGAEKRLEHIIEVAQREGLEVAALSARLHLGLCAWRRGSVPEARDAFEEVRQAARGNLFSHEFYACIGAAWSFAAEDRWTDAELCLMQAEDLRFDVRLSDAEAEELRLALRKLATDARRDDIVSRIEKIDVVGTKTSTTHHTQ